VAVRRTIKNKSRIFDFKVRTLPIDSYFLLVLDGSNIQLGAKRSSRAGIATIHLFSSVRNRHKTFDGPVNSSEMPMTISLLSNKEQKSSENKFFKIDATASSRAVNRRQ